MHDVVMISVGLWAFVLVGCGPSLADKVEDLEVPDGFSASLYAEIPGARSLALAPDGTVFVGTRDAGSVWAVPDDDHDGVGDATISVASGLDTPNGVAFLDGDLYVAGRTEVLRFPDVLARLDRPPAPEVVLRGLPTDEHHGWRYLAAGPDRMLYLSVGAPCNVCDRDDPFATIQRLDPRTGELSPVAVGVRNSMGFDWSPRTGRLWFTDNGRDGMGDDVPADELNMLTQDGEDFGFPYCHAGEVVDPELGVEGDCDAPTPPEMALQPHGASLGMAFARTGMLPEPWTDALFVAQHGSWDRSEPVGYRVAAVLLEEGLERPFVEGWLYDDGSAWGRPVDVLELYDGSLLISDDEAGALIRVAAE